MAPPRECDHVDGAAAGHRPIACPRRPSTAAAGRRCRARRSAAMLRKLSPAIAAARIASQVSSGCVVRAGCRLFAGRAAFCLQKRRRSSAWSSGVVLMMARRRRTRIDRLHRPVGLDAAQGRVVGQLHHRLHQLLQPRDGGHDCASTPSSLSSGTRTRHITDSSQSVCAAAASCSGSTLFAKRSSISSLISEHAHAQRPASLMVPPCCSPVRNPILGGTALEAVRLLVRRFSAAFRSLLFSVAMGVPRSSYEGAPRGSAPFQRVGPASLNASSAEGARARPLVAARS